MEKKQKFSKMKKENIINKMKMEIKLQQIKKISKMS